MAAKTTSFQDAPGNGDVSDPAAWTNGLPSRANGDTAIIDNSGAGVPVTDGAISAAFLQFSLQGAAIDLGSLDLSDVGQIQPAYGGAGGKNFNNEDTSNPLIPDPANPM